MSVSRLLSRIVQVDDSGEVVPGFTVKPLRRNPATGMEHFEVCAKRICPPDDFLDKGGRSIWQLIEELADGQRRATGRLVADGARREIPQFEWPGDSGLGHQLLKAAGYDIYADGEAAFFDVLISSVDTRLMAETPEQHVAERRQEPEDDVVSGGHQKTVDRQSALAWLCCQIRDGGKLDGQVKPKCMTNRKLFAEMKTKFGLGIGSSKKILTEAKGIMKAPGWGKPGRPRNKLLKK